MKVIGFDFGTTNSTISFYDAESKKLESFRMGGAAANDYIPSVVSYNRNKNDDVSIGTAAKLNITSKNFEVYENFKLRLGVSPNEVIGSGTKTPLEIARDFIKKLLEAYKSCQRIEKIDYIVMTVPETWFRETRNNTTNNIIEGIYKDLGFCDFEFQLESEPVAAAAYFCCAYENDNKINSVQKKYNGFITVIDYGGGTLDITLCEVANGVDIKILERCGFGEYSQTNGCAGVAFDEAVIEKLIDDNGLLITKGTPEFIKFRNSFEERKTMDCEKVSESLRYYFDDPSIMEGEVLFSLEYNGKEVNVCCEDLVRSFSKINAPALNDSLKQIKHYAGVHGIDTSNQENFRVLLVGGFSNFFCVEAETRKFFGATTENEDKRFEQPFPVRNRAFAVSKGAALIAQNEINVEHTCTHHIGYIVVTLDEMGCWAEKDVLVIKKGTKVADVRAAVFSDDTMCVRHKSGELRIFMDDGRPDNAGRVQAALDEPVGEIFPNIDCNDNEYKIGFSVSKYLIPSIHIKDKNGVEISESLDRFVFKQKQY